VNVAGIDLAQPVLNPRGLARARAVSLSVLSGQHLAGFLSLLNGLLDQSGTATRDVPAGLPAKRPSAMSLPPMKALVVTPAASLPPALIRSPVPDGTADTPVLIQTAEIASVGFTGEEAPAPSRGGTQGSSAPAASLPVAVQSLGPTSTSSGTSILDGNPLSLARHTAFALQLTWNPSARKNDAMMAGPSRSDSFSSASSGDPSTVESGTKNATHLDSSTNELAGLNEVASVVEPAVSEKTSEKTKLPTSDPEPPLDLFEGVAQSSQGIDQRAPASIWLLHAIPGGFLSPDSTAREVAGFRSPVTSELIRRGNMEGSSLPRDQAPAAGAATNSAEVEVQPQVFTRGPATIAEPPPALSPLGQQTPPSRIETQSEASTSQGPGQEQPGQAPEVAIPRRSPLLPSGSIAATQRTSPSDAGNMTGRGAANSESDPRAPRTPITDKAPQIRTSNPSSGPGGEGVWLNRVAEPGGPVQIQTKLSQPLQPPTAPPESEPTNAVQTQPIREISLRLATASANVDVQVTQRAGKVQVAVRASDQDLAKSLQINLGELMGHLEDKGFRTETWNPIAEQHGSSAVKEPANSANSQSQSDDAGSKGGQPGQRQGQQESNHRQPGRWKTQIDETLSAPLASAGEEKLWYRQ
jgi:hypothetical protein